MQRDVLMPMSNPLPPNRVSRRHLLTGVAIVSATAAATAVASPPDLPENVTIQGALPWQDGEAAVPDVALRTGERFLTAGERAFVTAAADRIIPPDETGPSASQAGVQNFIDFQLAGAYGAGAHLYLSGPWPAGVPSQGIQQRLAPAAFYRAAIAEIEAWIGSRYAGASFAALTADQQDEALRQLEAGQASLHSVDGSAFFTVLLKNVREGYFSDPAYGGNRGMAAWRMIGFPGARYDYSAWVSRHGEQVPYEPVGLLGRDGWRKLG